MLVDRQVKKMIDMWNFMSQEHLKVACCVFKYVILMILIDLVNKRMTFCLIIFFKKIPKLRIFFLMH